VESWYHISQQMEPVLDVPCYWKCDLILCWNFNIYLYDNIHNLSWELMNKFEINQMNKKNEKALIKHYNAFKHKRTCLIIWFFSKWQIFDKFLMQALSKYYKENYHDF
jgi:hypothetical protein